MTNQQILEKAVQKAIDGGWTDYRGLEAIELLKTTNFTVTLKGWVEFVDEGHIDESRTEIEYYYSELIFNHDFAKALWGELPLVETWRELNQLNAHEEYHHRYILGSSAWQYHLQMMVIADDPIKYLGESI